MYNIRSFGIRLISVFVAAIMFMIGTAAFAEADNAQENVYPERNRFTMDMEYLQEEQALRISQRLVYINRSSDDIDRVVFYAAGNMFRRESALKYEADDLEKVFLYGYAPGGVDIRSVKFNETETTWGMQGGDEMYLRVDCDIKSGESGVFDFEYYILLTECAAFMGIGETDVRLSAFYFIPGRYSEDYHEFNVNGMLPFTRWIDTDAADYDVTLTVPQNYDVAAVGSEIVESAEKGFRKWHISAENVREFAVNFGKKFRTDSKTTSSGTEVRAFTGLRRDAALNAAFEAVELCEKWFGPCPVRQMDIVQSDYPLDALNYPGLIWISSDLMKRENTAEMEKAIRFCVAQQYFGMGAYTAPVSDAWLSDSVCEYIAYLMIEETDGRNAFLKAINRDWVDAIQMTIPGGLTVTSDASLFESDEYAEVIRKRGAVVMHELRSAMGRDELIDGLAAFCEMGNDGHTLTEMEFVEAMDKVTGGSWEAFLTDWVFNVGDYVNQHIEWFE